MTVQLLNEVVRALCKTNSAERDEPPRMVAVYAVSWRSTERIAGNHEKLRQHDYAKNPKCNIRNMR
jgi:hypothetical protein